MDKNTLAHTKWNCKYHIVFGGVKLLWSFWLTDPKTPQQLDTAPARPSYCQSLKDGV